MEYPIKYVVVDGNVVVGKTVIYVEGATFTGPAGTKTIPLPIESPVDVGWGYVLDDSSNQYEFVEPTMTPNAGNGEPPPR